MKRLFYLTSAFFFIITGVFSCASQRQEPSTEKLEELKKGYESRAARYEDLGERLQFQEDSLMEARRYFRLAEENRRKAQEIEKQIEERKE